jgi:hypothetical protein
MKILILCVLALVLIFLLHRWNSIITTDYTKEHKSKLCKRVAGLMIITVCLMIYTTKEIFN